MSKISIRLLAFFSDSSDQMRRIRPNVSWTDHWREWSRALLRRKRELYDMAWEKDSLDLNQYIVAGATYGGPVGAPVCHGLLGVQVVSQAGRSSASARREEDRPARFIQLETNDIGPPLYCSFRAQRFVSSEPSVVADIHISRRGDGDMDLGVSPSHRRFRRVYQPPCDLVMSKYVLCAVAAGSSRWAGVTRSVSLWCAVLSAPICTPKPASL